MRLSVNWKRVAWWVTLFWLIYTASTEGNQPISLDVYPRITMAGFKRATLRVRMRIERHPDNRARSLQWEGTESGLSVNQMDGEDAPVFYERFIEVPVGDYWFEACVHRVGNRKFCANQTAEVR